jgi:hypothetical protein
VKIPTAQLQRIGAKESAGLNCLTAIQNCSEKELALIQPTASFKDNLLLLPSIESLARIELINSAGDVVASIENKPGKQGSLIIYQYMFQTFGTIDAKAAAHGLTVFAEHTADAKARPGAHPNIDLLLDILAGADPLSVQAISA